MNYKFRLTIIVPALFLLFVQASAQELKLVPEPKQIQRQQGSFTISSKTRIIINPAHADEDRTAAETLADEIEVATGQKLKISTSRSVPKSGAIYLARVGD